MMSIFSPENFGYWVKNGRGNRFGAWVPSYRYTCYPYEYVTPTVARWCHWLYIIIIVIICRLTMRAMSEYMTESEARAVARWEVGSCLRMVRKTKQVGFEPVFESLHRWIISCGSWDSIPNLGAQ